MIGKGIIKKKLSRNLYINFFQVNFCIHHNTVEI